MGLRISCHRLYIFQAICAPAHYIPSATPPRTARRPVAPAVSKSLHSSASRAVATDTSGCPRSLQVATFQAYLQARWIAVRLPPQSPSRYIPAGARPPGSPGPVAPAVSKSLHSHSAGESGRRESGCPRSLQVATFREGFDEKFDMVRLPPQSPSRYIPGRRRRAAPSGPVAPAVSKSLHSGREGVRRRTTSGCPRSLQVATFRHQVHGRPHPVRLPPQSPSRYILGIGRRS